MGLSEFGLPASSELHTPRSYKHFGPESTGSQNGNIFNPHTECHEFRGCTTPIDDYNQDVRKELGIDEDELFVLQPTRVVQRKGIEHAIELVARMKRKSVLVISHASGDEGYEYEQRVKEFAELLKIRALFVDNRIGDKRDTTEDGRKIYTLEDIYPHADLVTYPSLQEGFGNAFLEAVYFKNRYW